MDCEFDWGEALADQSKNGNQEHERLGENLMFYIKLNLYNTIIIWAWR